MPRAPDPGSRGDDDRPQDPRVERLRPDPSQPPTPSRTLEGLLGDSDRPGFRRLYLTAELDLYAEFRGEDVLAMADVPPDQPPFLGEPATRVTLRRDAPVDLTRSHQPTAQDDFDLDVRLTPVPGDVGGGGGGRPITFGEPGCLETFGFGCLDTRLTCHIGCELSTEVCTLGRDTCLTCATCATCGRQTCVTCFETCGGTCVTLCFGTCGEATCGPFTCGPRCVPTRLRCPPTRFVCDTRICEIDAMGGTQEARRRRGGWPPTSRACEL